MAFLSAVLLAGVPACFVMNLRPQIDVTHYRGEGSISQIRSAENPGFKVDFEDFSLAHPFKSRYRLDGIPRFDLPNFFEAGLVVKLTESEDSFGPKVPASLTAGSLGSLTIKLEDGTGSVISEGSVDITALYWRRFLKDYPFGRLWYQQFEKGQRLEEPLFLVASYAPGVDSVGRFANIRLSAGGYH